MSIYDLYEQGTDLVAPKATKFYRTYLRSGVHKGTGQAVIIKTHRIDPMEAAEMQRNDKFEYQTLIHQLRLEAHALERLKANENVVNRIDYEEDSTCLNEITIVMERARGMSLETQIGTAGPMQSHLFQQFGEQLIKAVTGMHRLGVVHRDLSPMNIFVEVQEEHLVGLTLIDLGLAYIRGSGIRHKAALTHGYAPPEAVGHLLRRVDTTHDIYSLGAILHYALTGQEAYGVPLLTTPDDEQGYRSIQRDDVPEHVKEQIRDCLRYDPKMRPASAADLRRMFRGKGW